MGKRHADPDACERAPKRGKYESTVTIAEQSPSSSLNDFVLTKELVDGSILTDIHKKDWRVGKPIGQGSFGEIFLASDDVHRAVNSDNAKYVVKIEPHSNGPLFVEIHCLLNVGRSTDDEPLPPGMPEYIASGSHFFKKAKYRFLILPRYKCDLHSIIKDRRVDQKNILVIAGQILDVLEHLHDKGYAHSDIKAENLMIGSCTYVKGAHKRQNGTGSSSSSCRNIEKDMEEEDDDEDENGEDGDGDDVADDESDEANDDEDDDDEDEENEDDETNKYEQSECDEVSVSTDEYGSDEQQDESDSEVNYRTPQRRIQKRLAKRIDVQFSGSNPVRSCRMSRKNSTYQDMLSSHYLRPSKKVNYHLSDDEDVASIDDKKDSDFKFRHAKVSPEKLLEIKKTIRVTEDRIYLIDFGLAIKFLDSLGIHRAFCMDQRRAHDGTLEFTSRDAHMGAHSRRSDLESLGYNLIYWSQASLPWKGAKLMNQPEQVHRMKEVFMTDFKIMFKHIYGKSAPKFLEDFMAYVGGLAYNDRPNYEYCRGIFASELRKLGCNADMVLNVAELKKRPQKQQKELENANAVKIKDVKSMMKLGLLIPFNHDASGNGSHRISPKNLRSKSEKLPKKQRKKFSWTEILSTDPDQIARQRAEKEFERDQHDTPNMSRYTGNPTHAIIAIENKIRFRERLDNRDDYIDKSDDSNHGKVEKTRKSNSNKCAMMTTSYEQRKKKNAGHDNGGGAGTESNRKEKTDGKIQMTNQRRKSGLRNYVRPTEKSLFYRDDVMKRKQRSLAANSEFTTSDESSSCSSNSVDVVAVPAPVPLQKNGRRYNSSCGMSSPASDEDSRDTTDYSPIKTRLKRTTATHYRKRKPLTTTVRKDTLNTKVTKKVSRDDPLKRIRAFTRG